MSLLLALSPFNFNDLLTGKELAHWLDWQGKLLDFNPADEVDVSIIFQSFFTVQKLGMQSMFYMFL